MIFKKEEFTTFTSTQNPIGGEIKKTSKVHNASGVYFTMAQSPATNEFLYFSIGAINGKGETEETKSFEALNQKGFFEAVDYFESLIEKRTPQPQPDPPSMGVFIYRKGLDCYADVYGDRIVIDYEDVALVFTPPQKKPFGRLDMYKSDKEKYDAIKSKFALNFSEEATDAYKEETGEEEVFVYKMTPYETSPPPQGGEPAEPEPESVNDEQLSPDQIEGEDEENMQGQNGEDQNEPGEDGDGEDGDGEDGDGDADGEGEDGEDGEDGKPGENDEPGEPGEPGENGQPGEDGEDGEPNNQSQPGDNEPGDENEGDGEMDNNQGANQPDRNATDEDLGEPGNGGGGRNQRAEDIPEEEPDAPVINVENETIINNLNRAFGFDVEDYFRKQSRMINQLNGWTPKEIKDQFYTQLGVNENVPIKEFIDDLKTRTSQYFI